MARSILIDSSTKDYVNLNNTGVIANANTLLTEMYTRIAIPKNGWMYSPDDTLGSDLYKLAGKRVTRSQQAVLQTVQNSQKPLLTQQRLKSYSVVPQGYDGFGRLTLSLTGVDEVGEILHFDYMVV